jgi:DNA-binding NtrC family response regulator
MDLLLVEDKDSFRDLLVKALAGTDWTVTAVGDPREALACLESSAVPVMVTDLRLPEMSGLELIRRAKRLRPELRAVLMSAFGEPKDIVEAMKLGTDDFLPKPFDLDAFLALLERLRALAGAPPPPPGEPWIALSPAMRSLDAALRRAAETDHPVLFTGPRGVGKARAARRLHTLRRPGAPYKEMQPGEVEDGTLRLLQGGSLHVADLDRLGPAAAEALARTMESLPGRAVFWSGGAGSAEAVAEPLRHHMGVITLAVPPLASRREDLTPLFQAFVARGAQASGRPVPVLDRSLVKALLAFQGEAGDLELAAARALLLNEGPVVKRLPDLEAGKDGLFLPAPGRAPLEAMEQALLQAARPHLLRRALGEAGGDLPKAAESLGLTVRVLAQRLRDAGIPLEDEGSP